MSHLIGSDLLTPLLASLTTDGAGADSVGLSTAGMLHAVEIQGSGLTGGTLTLVADTGGVLTTILTVAADQDVVLYPRTVEHDNAGADLLSYTYPIINGTLTVSVSGSGIAETASVYALMLENA